MSLRPAIRQNMPRGSVIETAPATEPVTAAELRAHLNESATGLPDAQANEFIAEARQYAEDITGLALITQSWRLSLDAWPLSRGEWWDGMREGSIAELHGGMASLDLPRYPLQSITSITVYNEASNATAVTVADVFDVDAYSVPGRITLQGGATWPVATRANNAIQIVYVAGYGAAGDVPAPLKAVIKRMAAYLYAHRGDGCDEAASAVGALGMLRSYKLARI